EVDQCYLESRELWADLEGLVSIKLPVHPNGGVSDSAVVMYDGTIHEPAVGCCITRGAKNWKFPASKDGKPYEVEHTFDLVTDIFRIRYRSTSEVGKPQPPSGTAIHHTW
ncbi:MAG TPA: AgmX/PglI C-terminal domain-containing protein, partial [Polyangiales bacterium]|nr:AgmX/PglI C-terminal domain-containing protein [Polyangiales bacterium]